MEPRFIVKSRNYNTNTVDVLFENLLSEEELEIIPEESRVQASQITKTVKIVISPDGSIDAAATKTRLQEQLRGAIEKAKAEINKFIPQSEVTDLLSEELDLEGGLQ